MVSAGPRAGQSLYLSLESRATASAAAQYQLAQLRLADHVLHRQLDQYAAGAVGKPERADTDQRFYGELCMVKIHFHFGQRERGRIWHRWGDDLFLFLQRQ